jgi:arginyl-tRNA synthetase
MKRELEATIGAAIKALFSIAVHVELTRPEEKFGDYATNVALQLSKQLSKPPREIAEQLAIRLRTDFDDSVQEVTIAGPGFLNLRLSDRALVTSLSVAHMPMRAGQTVLVEYSDPNPFKPLHAGHLYTTLVGDMIARLIAIDGATTIRLNYSGDVGLHVGKSMWAIVQTLGGELPDALEGLAEDARPAWLGARYVEGNSAYEDDPDAKAAINVYNKKAYAVQSENDHDSPFARIYWTCRQWSYDYFATLYDQLQVMPFDRYIAESEVTELGLKTVELQLKNGIYEESDGAVVFKGEAYGFHTRVFINRQGLPTYETKEVGLSLLKWQDYHFDASIIITANEQAQYMQVVMKSIEQFAPDPVERTKHLNHGVVKLAGGVKMSSRLGNTVTALQILEAAREAGAKSGTHPSEATILAAVKYAFAKNRIGADIIYDPLESVALEGNSGPYLQYAHARARSILRKATAIVVPLSLGELQPGERSLIRKLAEYPEVLELAARELLPHYICSYLFELAQTFNRFYEHNRVIGDAREEQRLALVADYADKLKAGLELLGIIALDKM